MFGVIVVSRLIGVTGIMGSGKTFLCNELIKKNKNISYINVDVFRLDLKENNSSFQKELFKNIKGLTNMENLNELIYSSVENNLIYKKILYKYLIKYLNSNMKKLKKIIIVDWALIIDDDLLDWFDKIILVTCSNDKIYKRLDGSYWSLMDIKNRISLQLSIDDKVKRLDEFEKQYMIVDSEQAVDYDMIMEFIL